MTKLNKKGFAVSTMLYGILTMVILILYLLLGTMRSSYNKEIATTEDILYYMNKCANKQFALEKCYMTYDDTPSSLKSCTDEYDTYISCVGVNSNNVVAGNKTHLKEAIISSADNINSGLIIDDLASTGDSKRYIYTGPYPKNYIKIGTQTGRILSRETDGSIKVVFDTTYSTQFEKNSTAQSGTEIWRNSILYGLLETKLKQMDYHDIYIKVDFYTGIIYESNSTKEAIANVRSEKFETNIGTITLEDYLKASANIKAGSTTYCNLENTTSRSIATDLSNCNSNNWLVSSNCLWTLTGFGGRDNVLVSEKLDTNETGIDLKKPITNTCNGKLVVYLSPNTKVLSAGTGEQTNPFVVDLRG